MDYARSLLWLAAAFMGGIAAEPYCLGAIPEGWLAGGVAALLVALVPFAFLVRFRDPHLFAASLLVFLALGLFAGKNASPPLTSPPVLEPFFDRPEALFLADVTAPPELYRDRLRVVLTLRAAFMDGKRQPVQGGVLLTLTKVSPSPGQWLFGDRLLVRLGLKRFHNFDNPGGYDYVRGQAEQGLHARALSSGDPLLVRLTPEDGALSVSSLPRAVARRLDLFRQEALFWLRNSLSPDAADFYAALLLGYRIPKAWAEHLSRSGVTHLLSISGLHLGLVSLSVFWLACRLVRLLAPSVLRSSSDQHYAMWAALVAAALYSLISGLALPTWRSLVMLTLFFAATFRYRYSDPLTALAAAAMLILLIAPNALRQISFQLSFTAMLGLFLVYPRFQRLQTKFWKRLFPPGEDHREHPVKRILSPFTDAFWASLAANVMVLPLLVYHFHGVSLAGFLANTVLVPFVGLLVLPPGLASLALFAIHEGVALPVLKVGSWFLEASLRAIVWFGELSWAFLWVGSPSMVTLAGLYAGVAILLAGLTWRKRVAGLLALCILFAFFSAVRHVAARSGNVPPLLEAVFIDVGQGTSTLVRFPEGEAVLVDGGGFFDDSFDIGRAVLAPFLWSQGIHRLDHIILSHDHPDHRNGLRFILSHFDVGSFWESGIIEPAIGRDELAAIAEKRGIPVRRIRNIPESHNLGPCRIEVLHPSPDYMENQWDNTDLNNVSLVLAIHYGNTRLILPGDIDQSAEAWLFRDVVPAGKTLLLAPHHGSERSCGSILLDRLRPQAVIFSCGFDNWFGFPSPGVLKRCDSRHIPYLRTDLYGAIRAVSDGRQWSLGSLSGKGPSWGDGGLPDPTK